MGKPKTQRTEEPYFAPSAETLTEVKALTLREEAKLSVDGKGGGKYKAMLKELKKQGGAIV